ncbi:Scr1 family TA system antitoxin-like transcriptional regulator [Streptomyces chrestomyceticus]|uniref:Scr1 family TA system antitoxin-like transcriptional regulator n=1 Tax=Streptomyces chrestomyceticus TaxID=68185 RepID=UPI0036CAF248
MDSGRGERTACGTRPHLSVSPPWHVPRTAAVGVQVRPARQKRLTDEPMLTMWPVVTEGVLLQQVGGPTVLRAQLEHLSAMAEESNVTVQGRRFSPGADAGMFGSYLLLSFARM